MVRMILLTLANLLMSSYQMLTLAKKSEIVFLDYSYGSFFTQMCFLINNQNLK